jgi:hypothetical protein
MEHNKEEVFEKGVLRMNAEELVLLEQIVNKHLGGYLDNFPRESANPSCWTLQDKIVELKRRSMSK